MIEGVIVSPRRQIIDERGKIMHMLRCDDKEFVQFGEVYFSWVNPGVIKGWHMHTRMTLNYTCPYGLIKLVIFDPRADSPTRGDIEEIFLGPDNYNLVTIPPGVWNGFKGIAPHPSLVCNCATHPHDPNEIKRLDPLSAEIKYDWGVKHG